MEIKDRFRKFLPVIVDVESAGFNEKTDALLEVSMMTVSMDAKGFLQPKEQFSANIRPFANSNIEKLNIDFLGIDPFDESRNLKDEKEALVPMFKAIAKEVKAQGCTRAILVGHNGFFDLKFIYAACERINYKKCPFHPFSVLDTSSLSSLILGHSVLAVACRIAGISFDDSKAHNAVYDTQKECELFCKLYNRYTTFAGLPSLASE